MRYLTCKSTLIVLSASARHFKLNTNKDEGVCLIKKKIAQTCVLLQRAKLWWKFLNVPEVKSVNNFWEGNKTDCLIKFDRKVNSKMNNQLNNQMLGKRIHLKIIIDAN